MNREEVFKTLSQKLKEEKIKEEIEEFSQDLYDLPEFELPKYVLSQIEKVAVVEEKINDKTIIMNEEEEEEEVEEIKIIKKKNKMERKINKLKEKREIKDLTLPLTQLYDNEVKKEFDYDKENDYSPEDMEYFEAGIPSTPDAYDSDETGESSESSISDYENLENKKLIKKDDDEINYDDSGNEYEEDGTIDKNENKTFILKISQDEDFEIIESEDEDYYGEECEDDKELIKESLFNEDYLNQEECF